MSFVHTIRYMDYEWDPIKRNTNLSKHGVDFIDAVLILEDELALTIEVDEESYKEKRFVTVGTDPEGRVLTMVYTYRNDKIRIISARKASKSERRQYQEINNER